MRTPSAWAKLITAFVLPLIHMGIPPKNGPWKAAADSGCPIGWLMILG